MSGEVHAIALTASGTGTAARLSSALGFRLHLPARLASANPTAEPFGVTVAELISSLWQDAGGFVLVMAAGIAVRAIAPLIKSKYSDPAVVVLDPAGRYVVPILSGHLGGANELAQKAALVLGGQAVITTATDAVGAPAIEVWAREAGLSIENPEMVARINRALAEGEGFALYLEPGVPAPDGMETLAPHAAVEFKERGRFDLFEGAKLAITDRVPTPQGALILHPRTLALGVGSRKGADPEGMREGVLKALLERGWSHHSVRSVSTIDIKQGEPAIVALAGGLKAPLLSFTSAELSRFPVANPSERVMREVGVTGVAESAAQAAMGGGRLVVEKINGGEWTLAVARLED